MNPNPAQPPPGTPIAQLGELSDPGAVCLAFAAGAARFSLILVRQGGQVFAWENRCPHARFPMERLDGSVILQDGRFLVCAAHGASFRCDTGKSVGGPGDGAGLTAVPITLDGETVRIG
jgi:nitrite reductase/ring-hydroxylating ferredoxin subunit